jgi:beta-galactosidase
VHRALFPRNVPIDYVHIDHLADGKLQQYKLVIFPYPLILPEASARLLAEYVRGGGVLVAEARLAWNNERGYASERIPGLGLWEVMGSRETAIETAPNGRTAIKWSSADLPGMKAGDLLPARWYKEQLEPTSPDARVVAEFEDGTPAAVMGSYGQGRTLMLGSYVSASAQSTPTPEAERFFAALLTWAGVTMPVDVSGTPIEARYLESGEDTLLFLFNHGKQAAQSEVTLQRAAGDFAATDLVSAATVPLTRTTAGVKLAITLDPSDVRIVRIARR